MDHIDETLTTQSHKHKFEVSIQVALGIPKKSLNKHYDKTDHSEFCHIAMCVIYFEFWYLL